jgi:hypothetical protein
MKGIFNLSLLLALLLLFLLSGCGSNRQLQSITVNPASAAATTQGGQVQFTATGQFNMSPMTTTPATVAWFPSFPVIDPVSSGFGFTLTNQPFTAQCLISGAMTVTAIAPMDTNASANGFIPIPIFMDLVRNHTATQEGGFVAATAQLTCP